MPSHRPHAPTAEERATWLLAERARRAAISLFKYTEPECYARRRTLAAATDKSQKEPAFHGRHAVA